MGPQDPLGYRAVQIPNTLYAHGCRGQVATAGCYILFCVGHGFEPWEASLRAVILNPGDTLESPHGAFKKNA